MALVQRLVRSAKDQYIIPESLTHSSGTISATVNGIGYSCSLSGLTANTLYFLYLRPSQANIQFVTTVPSSYRASFPEAVLIGAFYASGGNSFNGNTVEFGSFVTIEGPPKTLNKFNAGRLIVTAHTSNPTKGNGGVGNTDRMLVEVDGKFATIYTEYAQSTAGLAGTGNYFFEVPFAIDTSIHQTNSDSFSGANGQWNAYSNLLEGGHVSTSNSLGVYAGAQPFDVNRVRLWVFNATTSGFAAIGGQGSNFFPFNATDMEFSFTCRYQSSALSAIPLKDR